MNTPGQIIKNWMLCNTALFFISGCSGRVHHCFLYAQWLAFIYKSITGLLPTYLCLHRWCSCSQDFIQIRVPRGRTELGNKAFKCSSWTTWNNVKREFRLTYLVEKSSSPWLLWCKFMQTSPIEPRPVSVCFGDLGQHFTLLAQKAPSKEASSIYLTFFSKIWLLSSDGLTYTHLHPQTSKRPPPHAHRLSQRPAIYLTSC